MFDIDNYYEAQTLEQVKTLLHEHPKAKLIAGGSDILITIRDEPEEGTELVGLHFVDELKNIQVDSKGTLHVGAMVTFEALEKSDIITKHIPVLGQAAGTIGGPQLRRVATVGGNICNGAVSADTATSLFVLNAKLVLESVQGQRILDIADFYLGPGKTDVRQGEVLSEFLICKEDYDGFAGHYIKSSQRKALDLATIGVAVSCKKTDNNTISDVRISLGVAAPTPIRCPIAEAFAKGKTFTRENIKLIGEKALENAKPRDSWRGSKAYREQLIKVNTERGIINCILALGGKIED